MASLERMAYRSVDVHIAQIHLNNGKDTEFLITGIPVAKLVGYKSASNALYKHVKPQWRRTWVDIRVALRGCPSDVPSNWRPNTVFITEAGVYALIMRSKCPEAEKFQAWLFEEVLPELRRRGTYSTAVELYKTKLELSKTRARYDSTIVELKAAHERELYEMKLKMKDMANSSFTQFAVNAMIAENEKLRTTLAPNHSTASDTYIPQRVQNVFNNIHNYVVNINYQMYPTDSPPKPKQIAP